MGRYVEERSYKRFAEACLETTIVMYVDRLLIQVCIHLSAGNIHFYAHVTYDIHWSIC